MVEAFDTRGWARFAPDPAIAAWAAHAVGPSREALRDPALAHWHVCENTWFVGVDALPNDGAGRLPGGPAARGAVWDWLAARYRGVNPLHKAQLSVVSPGYPRPREGESEGAFRYRQKRDAAHVDGLRAVGPERTRHLMEPHAYILGLPLNPVPAEAAPLVVWEGSHHILRAAFAHAFDGQAAADWHKVDLTGIYQAARAEVFERCPRVVLPASPGEALLLHRHLLHGVAPWAARGTGAEGRMIAYFRPEFADPADWMQEG